MPEPTNRRGLLRALMRSAGESFGKDLVEAVEAAQAPFETAAAEAARPGPPPVLTQPPPVTRSLTVAELDDLVAEEGLAGRRDAVHALARPATRLTPSIGAGPNRSWIGRPTDTAPAGETMAAVAEIDLADPALADGPLSGTDRLRVLIADPPGGTIARCSRARLSVVPEPDPPHGRSMNLSTELALPRVWAAPVQALELDEAEHAAYARLRARVAELQGVTAEDGDAEGVAVHHLLGYPTETSGAMPIVCELAARELDPETAPVDVAEDVVVESERWRLLLQVTQDEHSGVTLGAGVARLYLWIDQDALSRHDFSDVWAIAR